MARKLTDQQKIEIVEKYLTGEFTCIALAKLFKVSDRNISQILKYRGVEIVK